MTTPYILVSNMLKVIEESKSLHQHMMVKYEHLSSVNISNYSDEDKEAHFKELKSMHYHSEIYNNNVILYKDKLIDIIRDL